MRIILSCLLVFLAVQATAQSDTSKTWNTVIAAAKIGNKPALIYFSGSDWCASCAQFKKHVLADPSFAAYLDSAYVFYNADFPSRTKQDKQTAADNEKLAEQYNPGGSYPTLVVISSEGVLIGKISYVNTKTAAAYIGELEKLKR